MVNTVSWTSNRSSLDTKMCHFWGFWRIVDFDHLACQKSDLVGSLCVWFMCTQLKWESASNSKTATKIRPLLVCACRSSKPKQWFLRSNRHATISVSFLKKYVFEFEFWSNLVDDFPSSIWLGHWFWDYLYKMHVYFDVLHDRFRTFQKRTSRFLKSRRFLIGAYKQKHQKRPLFWVHGFRVLERFCDKCLIDGKEDLDTKICVTFCFETQKSLWF